jgi:hypothetical protein
MQDNILKLLDLQRLPGRLTPEQAAQLLGFAPHDIPVLVKSRLLKPLGNPPQQAVKYFPATEVEKNANDPEWLNRATRAIYAHWISQNEKRASRTASTEISDGGVPHRRCIAAGQQN